MKLKKTILISFLFIFAVTFAQLSFCYAEEDPGCLDPPSCVTLAKDYKPHSDECGRDGCDSWGFFNQCKYDDDYIFDCTSESCPKCCWAINCELAPPPPS